jgi:hypothetical protein
VLKFHRLIDQWLITNGGTLNQAVVSHEMNAYLSQLNERAEARGERRRREARSENSPRSRTDAKSSSALIKTVLHLALVVFVCRRFLSYVSVPSSDMPLNIGSYAAE